MWTGTALTVSILALWLVSIPPIARGLDARYTALGRFSIEFQILNGVIGGGVLTPQYPLSAPPANRWSIIRVRRQPSHHETYGFAWPIVQHAEIHIPPNFLTKLIAGKPVTLGPSPGSRPIGTRYLFLVPFWLPALVSASLTVLLWYRSHAKPGHCPNCNYNMTGNVSGKCPECGMPLIGSPIEQTRTTSAPPRLDHSDQSG